jgi:hypothetical protein
MADKRTPEQIGTNWRWLLFLLLGLALVRGVGYALLIPPWQSPDETGHFEYAWLIANSRKLFNPDLAIDFEAEYLSSLYEWRYGEFIQRPLPDKMPARINELPRNIFAARSRTILISRFSLSYVWQALFLYPFRYQDLVFQLYVARISSVLLNVGIIGMAARIFRRLLPRQGALTTVMVAVLVFWPQHTFINGMVGEGALAELMVLVVLYGWVRLFSFRGESIGGGLVIIGTLVAIWSKITSAFLIPLNVGLFIWWIYEHLTHYWKWFHWLYIFASIAVLGMGGWVWSKSALATKVLMRVGLLFNGSGLLWVDERGVTFWKALLSTHDSFWANFGWMNLGVSERWYGGLLSITILALIGLIWQWGKQGVWNWRTVLMVSFEVVAWVTYIWAAILSKSDSGYYGAQGRYLFPIAVPHVFLLVRGWRGLFSSSFKPLAAAFLLISLVGFDIWCIVGYILPYYYGG